MNLSVNKPSIYELNETVKKGDLLISTTTDFNLTEGRIYVAVANQGENTFHDCVAVINDKGEQEEYTTEYFARYEGELVIYKAGR